MEGKCDMNELEVFDFLNGLKESGLTNMLGAIPIVEVRFEISRDDATVVVEKWLQSVAAAASSFSEKNAETKSSNDDDG
tara:strand:- start:1713 stop:1949 length:237 start_codon:yes stop_codon:yes gene_type:complete